MRLKEIIILIEILFVNSNLLGGVNQWCSEGTITQTTVNLNLFFQIIF